MIILIQFILNSFYCVFLKNWKKGSLFFETTHLVNTARCWWVCSNWQTLSQQVHSEQQHNRERTVVVATIMRFQLGKRRRIPCCWVSHTSTTPLLHLCCRLTDSLHLTTKLSRDFFVCFKKKTAGKKTRNNAWREAKEREGYTRVSLHPPFSAIRIQSRYSKTLRSSCEIWLQPRLMCQSQAWKHQLKAVWALHRAKKLENSMLICDPTHL